MKKVKSRQKGKKCKECNSSQIRVYPKKVWDGRKHKPIKWRCYRCGETGL